MCEIFASMNAIMVNICEYKSNQIGCDSRGSSRDVSVGRTRGRGSFDSTNRPRLINIYNRY